MNELNRTGVFVAIAVVLSAVTYFTMPSIEQQSPASMVGKALFPKFEDPLEATSLEVVKFDKDTATANTFKVAKVGDSWVIPSHNNYPADAKDQLADVAAEWINLEVLGVATDPQEAGIKTDNMRELHKLYGVVDPVGEESGDNEGVGTRVVMRDKSDNELVRLIIGKEVEGQSGLRYVRLIGQDPVYTVKASTSKLSTKFEDWIEDDLLKLSSWDIRKVDIDDYSIDILQGYLTPRGQISLAYNDTGDPRWTMPVDRVYTKDGWKDRGLGENEELNTDTLNKLKNALDDLKIVDVVRKPQGLSDTLKSSGSINLDPEAERSLSRAGFHVIPVSDPADPTKKYYELRSNEGEISVSMKTGVRYVLRFGQIAGMGASEEDEAAKKEGGAEEDEKKDEKTSDSKVNRYLFVMAQMDRSMIEEPKYEELPELPPENAKAEESKAADAQTKKADEAKPADANSDKPKELKPEDKKTDKPEDAKAGEAKPDEAGEEKAEAKQPEPSKADDPKADEKKADEKKAEGAKDEQPKPTREEIEKKREGIQKENDRKKEEYEEKLKEGEDKVKELNARFADWYYIIDDNEYQKIHLGRDKLVKEKEKKEEDKKSDNASAGSPAKPAAETDSIGEFESLKEAAPKKK